MESILIPAYKHNIYQILNDFAKSQCYDCQIVTLQTKYGDTDQQSEHTCKKSTASSDNLRAQIKDYLEDSARARMEVDVARREIERLNREISSLRERIAENK